MPINKKKKLTTKQAMFLKEYFKTGNGTRSAMKVYDTDDKKTASVIASENLVKLRHVVQTWMDMEGLTIKSMVKKLKEATNADKIITSHTEPDYTMPDHQVRLKAIEMAARWLNIEQPAGTYIQQNVGEMNISFSQ